MSKIFYYVMIPIVFILIGWFANVAWNLPRNSNPISEIKPRPLDKYTIENLAKRKAPSTEIKIGKLIKDFKNFSSYEFTFSFDPTLSNGQNKTVSGLINIPKTKGPFPVILMLRGYVDQKAYTIGEGTEHAAEFFAQNGFITVAPDFLGYGDSDPEAANAFEARFQTYTTAMTALSSISTLNNWDGKNIFIWGHSNGGQIALTLLEETSTTAPTVLWAPVSKPFPYSILYYTIEADDGGKSLRKELANFENDYDTDLYSLTRFFDLIKAPIQINQGTADPEVPLSWSEDLLKNLKNASVSGTLNTFPNADHNLTPGWQNVVDVNLNFFQKNIR